MLSSVDVHTVSGGTIRLLVQESEPRQVPLTDARNYEYIFHLLMGTAADLDQHCSRQDSFGYHTLQPFCCWDQEEYDREEPEPYAYRRDDVVAILLCHTLPTELRTSSFAVFGNALLGWESSSV